MFYRLPTVLAFLMVLAAVFCAVMTGALVFASHAKAETGMASYYGGGGITACGQRFNPSALTAAHKSLPCGSRVSVTNLKSGRSVVVTITDRGPFVKGRIIDVSYAAASYLGFVGSGVARVNVTVLGGGYSGLKPKYQPVPKASTQNKEKRPKESQGRQSLKNRNREAAKYKRPPTASIEPIFKFF